MIQTRICLLLLVALLSHFGWAQLSTLTSSRRGDLDNPDDQNIRLSEEERVVEYHKRNYTWPLQKYIPDTPGWKSLMENRFNQVEEIQDSGKRYEGYMQTIHTAFLVPNFTEHGFGLARCPQELLEALQEGISEGVPTARLEHSVEVIDGPQALFVERPDLTRRVLHELQHYAETWAQIPLTPYRAYGFRLYRNHSRLYMHVDKVQTHIVSFILHIDSSIDAEPWPIYIEDFHGRTHEVLLTPGDMLFYESSKCFHGRPKRLNGSWYTSIFVHYYPSGGWYDINHALESHYAIPPRWLKPAPSNPQHQKLEMVGTSMREPGCENDWCGTESPVRWSGPGEEGFWIAPNGDKFPFNPKRVDYNDEL